MKKLILYIVVLLLSIIVYITIDVKEEINIPIQEKETFPPKEYLDKLEDMEVQ